MASGVSGLGAMRSTVKTGSSCLPLRSKISSRLRCSAAAWITGNNACPGVRSTMAKRFSPASSRRLVIVCTTTAPHMRSGMRMRLTRKDLVRTAAWYSRAAMTRILCTVVLLFVRAGDADKDVVQRWAGQLEMADFAPAHQRGQYVLGVRTARQAQFLPAAEVRNLDDAGQITEWTLAVVKPNLERVVAVRILDRFECSIKDFLTFVDHENEVAHLLGHVHIMSRENDGRPGALDIQHR